MPKEIKKMFRKHRDKMIHALKDMRDVRGLEKTRVALKGAIDTLTQELIEIGGDNE